MVEIMVGGVVGGGGGGGERVIQSYLSWTVLYGASIV